MHLLNFAHPLTEDHLTRIQEIIGQDIEHVIDIPSQIDAQQPLLPQVIAMVEQVGFSITEWQTKPFLVNPPALNYIAVTLLAELHGRCGFFPTCLRLRPVSGSVPTRFEIAEVLNLQQVRDRAREERSRS